MIRSDFLQPQAVILLYVLINFRK